MALKMIRFNKAILILLLLSSLFGLNSCNNLDEVESDKTGEGFIQINDLKFDVDFVSINGPYLTIGCDNSVKIQLWYSTLNESEQIFVPESIGQGSKVEGTFSAVDLTLNDNPFCWPYGRNIKEGSYLKINSLGDGKYQFKAEMYLENCKTIDLIIAYEGKIYYEDESCYGCDRPCTTKDTSYLNDVPENQVLKIEGQSYEELFSYNDDDILVYSVKHLSGNSIGFGYEDNLLTSFSYSYLGEATIYNIQNENDKIKRVFTNEPFSFWHEISYFIYENDRIVQSLDSLESYEVFPFEKQLLGTTQFEYDVKGNLIKKTIIRDNKIEEEIEYQYDDKINPFYQMYHSWDEKFTPITCPNNVSGIFYTNLNDPSQNYTKEYVFDYDSRGYPVSYIINGGTKMTVEYYNYHF